MSDHKLPTFRDVMLHYLFVLNDLKKSPGKCPNASEMFKNVVPKLKKFGKNHRIPSFLEIIYGIN